MALTRNFYEYTSLLLRCLINWGIFVYTPYGVGTLKNWRVIGYQVTEVSIYIVYLLNYFIFILSLSLLLPVALHSCELLKAIPNYSVLHLYTFTYYIVICFYIIKFQFKMTYINYLWGNVLYKYVEYFHFDN